MAHRIVADEADRADLIRLFEGLSLPFTVEWSAGRDRSLEQNRLQFQWAREAADQRGDVTPDEVRRDWKLRHGVPILREASASVRETYDRVLRPLPFEDKLRAMSLVEVSSLMTVRQMVQYLDTVQRECAEQGIRLTDPDPDLASYHSRYRRKEAA